MNHKKSHLKFVIQTARVLILQLIVIIENQRTPLTVIAHAMLEKDLQRKAGFCSNQIFTPYNIHDNRRTLFDHTNFLISHNKLCTP